MRVIDAFDEPVRAVAVSPDGRFMAATTRHNLYAWDWVTGERVYDFRSVREFDTSAQPAFAGGTLLFTHTGWLNAVELPGGQFRSVAPGRFSGAVAVSPDGKRVAATRAGRDGEKLEEWEFPAFRAKSGFDFWPPFDRLAFSPSGEFLAGINLGRFELRIAISGGKNGWQGARGWGHGAYLTFARDSRTVVYGWDTEFHVMETHNGSVSKRVRASGDELFLDAAFLGGGRLLAVADGTPELRVWSAESWEVIRGYDWGAGGVRCATATADGLAGVCGTETGKLVVFDVDE